MLSVRRRSVGSDLGRQDVVACRQEDVLINIKLPYGCCPGFESLGSVGGTGSNVNGIAPAGLIHVQGPTCGIFIAAVAFDYAVGIKFSAKGSFEARVLNGKSEVCRSCTRSRLSETIHSDGGLEVIYVFFGDVVACYGCFGSGNGLIESIKSGVSQSGIIFGFVYQILKIDGAYAGRSVV